MPRDGIVFFNWIFLHVVSDHILGGRLSLHLAIRITNSLKFTFQSKEWKLAFMQIVLLSAKGDESDFKLLNHEKKKCFISFCYRHLPKQRLVSSVQIHSGNFPLGLRMMVIKSLLEIVMWSACLHARLPGRTRALTTSTLECLKSPKSVYSNHQSHNWNATWSK